MTSSSSSPSSTPPAGSTSVDVNGKELESGTTQHRETAIKLPPGSAAKGWKLSSKDKKAGDGDTALALFTDLDDLHNSVDPEEERKLVRKIDLMILPYL